MAIELEKRELRIYEIRKKKYKQRVAMITIFLLLIGLIVGTFIIKQILDKNYNGYEVIQSTKRQDSTSAKYISYESGTVRYSRDGAMAFTSDGTMLWNGTYEMKDPIIDICDKYVVIADRGSKTIQIYNGKGNVSNISVLYNIKKVEIANQGVIAVLMEGKGRDYIELYKEDGTFLVDIATTNNRDGYPLDMSLSNDGRKLVTSYTAISNGILQSKVTFYNFGEVGQNYIDRLVGSFDFGQTLVPDVQFINEKTVVAFGDNKFSVFNMNETPSLLFEKAFESEIKSIMYNEKYIGFVLNNLEGEEKHQLLIYDLEGNVLTKRNNNFNYNQISISGDDVIMVSDSSSTIVTVYGDKKFEYTFEKNIVGLYPVNNKDEYLLIDDVNMEKIKLVEE